MDNQNNLVNETPTVEPTVVPTVEPNVAPTIDPSVVPQSQTAAPLTPAEPAKPKSNKGIIIACIAVLVLIGAGIGVYFGFFRKVSGKQVVNGTINKIFESAIKASEKVEKNFVIDYKKDIVRANGSVKASVNTDDAELKQQLNNLYNVAIDYDVRLDLKNLSGSIDLTEKENDEAIIKVSTLLKDKMLYMKTDKTSVILKQDFSDEIDWDAIDISKLPDYKSNSITALLKKSQTYIKDSIKDEYISQEEGEYTVDGVNVKGLKTTITLTSDRLQDMYKSVLNSLINDDEGLTLLSEYLMTDKTEVKSSLEKTRDQIGVSDNKTITADDEEKELKINIYTTRVGKFLAFDALDDEKKNGITAVSQDNVTVIKVLDEGEVTFKMDYNEKEKELVWKNDAEGNKNEKVVIKFLENGLKVTFSMDNLSVTVEFTETINNESVDMYFNAGFDYTQDGKKLGANLEYKNSLSKADSVETFDTTGSKDVEKMTEAEANQFMEDLETALGKSTIFSILMEYAEESQKKVTNQNIAYNYSNPYCSQAYDCKNYGGDYDYCKYDMSGEAYTILCPASE